MHIYIYIHLHIFCMYVYRFSGYHEEMKDVGGYDLYARLYRFEWKLGQPAKNQVCLNRFTFFNPCG